MMTEKICSEDRNETRAKLRDPKRRGMILEPEHETEVPSAVRSMTPEEDEEAVAGNTEKEASESTRKWQEDSLSQR